MAENLFSTSDIVLAATLKSIGKTLHHIEKTGNKGTFYFEDVHLSDITDFDTGKCKVEPVTFNGNIKQLTTACRRML
jgi:hypothetical protein